MRKRTFRAVMRLLVDSDPGFDTGGQQRGTMLMNTGVTTAAGVFMLALAASPALAQQESFVMPSGNIECTYTGPAGTSVYQPQGGMAELSCDRES